MNKLSEVKKSFGNTFYIGSLPLGCRFCLRGSKLVLFITGLCDKNCFYCPLSDSRKNVDKVFADELEVSTDLEVILEAKSISAKGAGFTGGDPLLTPKKTLHYLKLLKDFFGKDFHVHLYTTGKYASKQVLLELKRHGLDEIRFHPEVEWWKAIENALNVGLTTGAEMPVIPREEYLNLLKRFMKYLSSIKAHFINLNELEICPPNYLALKQRGFKLAKNSLSAVEGSEEAAFQLLNWALTQGLELDVHYCPSIVKDRAQVKRRLARRAKNVVKGYQRVIGYQALLECIEIRLPKDFKINKTSLCMHLNIKPHMLKLVQEKGSLIIYINPQSPWRALVEKLKRDGGELIEVRRVKLLPSYKKTEVLSVPLSIKF
ncbi:MAG: radical SAM protein [Candidatus Methanomethylicota archaeon]|uniref:Radical SAM protein n=1 Tax=Thermoproteota archaeon TaxID=2056631 RepID=A0A497ETS0_9CREN|nr:MAG: radical SAM protein [Candidatus Verstraetearchaeota archaeon]